MDTHSIYNTDTKNTEDTDKFYLTKHWIDRQDAWPVGCWHYNNQPTLLMLKIKIQPQGWNSCSRVPRNVQTALKTHASSWAVFLCLVTVICPWGLVLGWLRILNWTIKPNILKKMEKITRNNSKCLITRNEGEKLTNEKQQLDNRARTVLPGGKQWCLAKGSSARSARSVGMTPPMVWAQTLAQGSG